QMDQGAIEPEHPAAGGAAERGRAFRDSLEDRPRVARRARDHPQDLARGLLLLNGVGDFDSALLEFYLKLFKALPKIRYAPSLGTFRLSRHDLRSSRMICPRGGGNPACSPCRNR